MDGELRGEHSWGSRDRLYTLFRMLACRRDSMGGGVERAFWLLVVTTGSGARRWREHNLQAEHNTPAPRGHKLAAESPGVVR